MQREDGVAGEPGGGAEHEDAALAEGVVDAVQQQRGADVARGRRGEDQGDEGVAEGVVGLDLEGELVGPWTEWPEDGPEDGRTHVWKRRLLGTLSSVPQVPDSNLEHSPRKPRHAGP